jgi:hypothetical protein
VGCAALAALVAVGLALATRADAYVYWSGSDAIGRAGLNGSGVNQRFVATAGGVFAEPAGVAVDGAHIYWGGNRPVSARIGRASLDGSGANEDFIAGLPGSGLAGLAVDGTHVYWADSRRNSIGRANLDGSGVNQSFIAGASNPRGVAVDGAHVYWANFSTNTIGRANLDGSGVNQSFIAGASLPYGIAVDRAHVYWANSRTIGRSRLDGSGVDQSFVAARGWSVAVDKQHIYWTASRTPGSAAIGRASLAGSGADENFIANVSGGWVAVDALPSNAFSFGRTRVLADGSAQLELRVPGPGALSGEDAAGGRKARAARRKKRRSAMIKRVRTRAAKAGTVTLTLRPTAAAQRLLRRGRAVPVKVKVAFTPTGGSRATKTTRITLRKTKSSEGCRVANSGGITTTGGDKATFSGNARVRRGPKGNETYEDRGPATPLKVKSFKVLAIKCNRSGTRASILGTAKVSGRGSVDSRIDVADRGKTGRNDTYRIRLTNVYDSGNQRLEQGNVRIRR